MNVNALRTLLSKGEGEIEKVVFGEVEIDLTGRRVRPSYKDGKVVLMIEDLVRQEEVKVVEEVIEEEVEVVEEPEQLVTKQKRKSHGN
jgi:hypothetical protein